MSAAVMLTLFRKAGGPLSKRIRLSATGEIVSDASACIMVRGTAERVYVRDTAELAALIESCASDQALALGALRADLPDRVEVVTKQTLTAINGTPRPDVIARTGEALRYTPQQLTFALFDLDTKLMPEAISARINNSGGFWNTLVSVLPALQGVARVERLSTSAGLFHADTKMRIASSNGRHVYLLVADGSDIERFLVSLHARCVLAGFGWLIVGAGGQVLERSIIDRMVGAPERLVFEGPPLLEPPLTQDCESRRPQAHEGEALDTMAACAPLTVVEQAALKEWRSREAHRLAPARAEGRAKFIAEQAARVAARHEISIERAIQVVEQQCRGVLLPHVELPFDDEALAGTTVAEVLADPASFEGATLADPLEGIDYGPCKAKVMVRADGSVWINSFAHGHTVYELRNGSEAICKAIREAAKEDVVRLLVREVLATDLAPDELQALIGLAAECSGVGKLAIKQTLRAERDRLDQQRMRDLRERRIAERCDPRPQIDVPELDAPWLPQMEVINEVLGASQEPEPPMRDGEGYLVEVQNRRPAGMHALTSLGANQEDTSSTRLPPPEHPLLVRLDPMQAAETIERYIDYADLGRSVHLPTSFVTHYVHRLDSALPLVFGVATMPMVLPDATMLSGFGLDRRYNIVFRVAPELEALLPRREDCTPAVVAGAIQFLTEEWLVDVSTDYEGKCIALSYALTILQRYLLPSRPAFVIGAGHRGTGKTTLINMVSTASLGAPAAAAAWSPSEEERRKALFSYFLQGVPSILWDNIPLGTAISCPSIEKALTTEIYSDRQLQFSKTPSVSAQTVQAFTGNNISAHGDMASRVLNIRLVADRPDPENRQVKHVDPIGWTLDNRGRILRALFTILLGNPLLGNSEPAEKGTRFRRWYYLVGAAVENGAQWHAEQVQAKAVALCEPCPAKPISILDQFLAGEAEDEKTAGLITVLDMMRTKWPTFATAADVASYCAQMNEEAIAFKVAIEQASLNVLKVITAHTLTWRLKAITDAPVFVGNDVLVLRYQKGHEGGVFRVAKLSR
jgi:hypothetical protein